MNESFKTDPSLATSARAANESGSYLCASNVTPTTVRFIVSVFLCLLCSCRMSSTQMTCSHFRKNRPKKIQKPAGCRSRIISKNRPVPIFGRSTGASLIMNARVFLFWLLELYKVNSVFSKLQKSFSLLNKDICLHKMAFSSIWPLTSSGLRKVGYTLFLGDPCTQIQLSLAVIL